MILIDMQAHYWDILTIAPTRWSSFLKFTATPLEYCTRFMQILPNISKTHIQSNSIISPISFLKFQEENKLKQKI
jgi:hypothetical protein